MKLSTNLNSKNKAIKRIILEDYRYLQKKISGSSVYRNVKHSYKRTPKHKNNWLKQLNEDVSVNKGKYSATIE